MNAPAWTDRFERAALLVGALGCGGEPTAKDDSGTEAADVPFLAFYYPWYGTPDGSGQWRHWNDAGHDPEQVDADGLRDIAAVRHPEGDVYDSQEEAVIARHVADASDVGIDAFIASWWEAGSFEEEAIAGLYDEVEASGSDLRVALYYEDVPDFDAANAIAELEHLSETFLSRPAAYTWEGRPVVFVYARAIFPSYFCTFEDCPDDTPEEVDWGTIVAAFPDVDFVGDALMYGNARLFLPRIAEMGFQGAHIYNCHLDSLVSEDMAATYADFAAESHDLGLTAAATVIPGYDDTALDRPTPLVVDREDGALYERLLAGAFQSGSEWVLLTTWNEWHEGSEIEASVELGDEYLERTMDGAQ